MKFPASGRRCLLIEVRGKCKYVYALRYSDYTEITLNTFNNGKKDFKKKPASIALVPDSITAGVFFF